MRNIYRILIGKLEGNRPLGDLGVNGRVIIKMDFKEIGYEVEDWIHLPQNRDELWALVNAILEIGVP
jgi:hypothetical protein